MANLKQQTIGVWFALVTLVLGIVSFIAYFINIAGQGYFHGAKVDMAVRYMVIEIIVGVCVMALTFLPVKTNVSGLVTFFADLGRIVIPALSIAAVLAIVSARVEGFAFIYFSNAEVLQEVQTSANIASAHGAIANIVLLTVTAIVGIVGAFFSLKKDN